MEYMSEGNSQPSNAATRAEAVFGFQLQQSLLSVENTVRQLKGRIVGLQQRLDVAGQELDSKGYEAVMQTLVELAPEVTRLQELRRSLDVQREAVITIKQSLDKICRER